MFEGFSVSMASNIILPTKKAWKVLNLQAPVVFNSTVVRCLDMGKERRRSVRKLAILLRVIVRYQVR